MARPRKFTLEEIEEKWQEYKRECDDYVQEEVSAGKVVEVKRPRVYTLSAFQTYLGLSRQAWSEYRAHKKFGDTIKRIEDEVFSRKEAALVNAEGSTTGLIFDMKANYGINDKTVIDAHIEGGYDITLNLGGPAAKEGQ